MSRPDGAPAHDVTPISEVFAALGHPARLALIERLEDRGVRSLSELAAAAPVTRQATARPLEVLAAAGLVRRTRVGRETLFALSPAPLGAASDYLAAATARWESALERLRRHVEERP